MITTVKIWKAVIRKEAYSSTKLSQLWSNPELPHLDSIQDPGAWTKYGVKRISQVLQGEKFYTYVEIRQLWKFPENYVFRYMQLIHALLAQFPGGTPQLMELGLEQMVRKGKK